MNSLCGEFKNIAIVVHIVQVNFFIINLCSFRSCIALCNIFAMDKVPSMEPNIALALQWSKSSKRQRSGTHCPVATYRWRDQYINIGIKCLFPTRQLHGTLLHVGDIGGIHEAMVQDSAADIRWKKFYRTLSVHSIELQLIFLQRIALSKTPHGISLLCLLRKLCIQNCISERGKAQNDQTERRRKKKIQETEKPAKR